MEEATPLSRFVAINVGQLSGVLLFFSVVFAFIGTGGPESEIHRSDINFVLKVIGIAGGFVFLALLVGLCVVLFLVRQSGEFKHEHVDGLLWAFVIVDLIVLLFTVSQQGGLSRSMFVPVFFLIPAAYLAVVRESKISTTYYLLAVIGVCVFISFWVSHYRASHSNFTELPLLSVKITDFYRLDPDGYNWAFFIVCGVSLLIPALQLWIKVWLATKSA